MIEKIVLDYLDSVLDVPVYMEMPEDDLDSFVIIEKTGSDKVDHIPSATFAFQSYGKTMLQAAQLNEAVKEAVENLITLDAIGRARLNSDYNYTDTAMKRYRYQAVYVITY